MQSKLTVVGGAAPRDAARATPAAGARPPRGSDTEGIASVRIIHSQVFFLQTMSERMQTFGECCIGILKLEVGGIIWILQISASRRKDGCRKEVWIERSRKGGAESTPPMKIPHSN